MHNTKTHADNIAGLTPSVFYKSGHVSSMLQEVYFLQLTETKLLPVRERVVDVLNQPQL